MAIEAEAADMSVLFNAVRQTLGLQLENYRGRQLERRLTFFRQRHGLASNIEVAARLRSDAAFRQEFSDFMTINVSEFFRNPERFNDLREQHLPELLRQRPSLKVWSAGCSIGAEIYSLTMLLQELAPGRRHQLLATDIDETILRRGQAGVYPAADVREVPAPLMQRYFTETPAGWAVQPAIKSQVTFRRHDLLQDPFPADQDLIICRNVVIYFTDEAKAQLYRRFQAALRPGGLLFIGATESIFEARAMGLQYLAPCFYSKPAGVAG